MTKPNGIILYRGPSTVNGEPIVVILTGLEKPSQNADVGPSLQTWIMPDPQVAGLPQEAARSGADVSACGGCHARPSLGGFCYVTLFQGPRSCADAYLRGVYPDCEGQPILDKLARAAQRLRRMTGLAPLLRLGAWGDPVSVPSHVWLQLLSDWRQVGMDNAHTGYTHQWRRPEAAWAVGILEASVDAPDERRVAKAAGWSTFRVRHADEGLEPGERHCPKGQAKAVRCVDCLACDGQGLDHVILAHGAKAARFQAAQVARLRARVPQALAMGKSQGIIP
jgi:hypothetical protein